MENRSPIFVAGCGHSGTSLLLNILGAHSNIYAVPYETRFAFKPSETQKALIKGFNKATQEAGKKRWVEKTAQHALKVGYLKKMFPDALFVLMIRDGRDVACSIKARTDSFGHGVKRWVSDNRQAEKHWSTQRVAVIRYERLIEDFEATVSWVTCFLSEAYEPAMKNYRESLSKIEVDGQAPITPKEHEKFRAWQVRQPLFDGRGRWKKDMSEEEKRFFKEKAGKMLIEYGYAQDETW